MTEVRVVEAIKELLSESPEKRILVLATFVAGGEIVPALRDGAIDCCLKDMPCEEMAHVIRAVGAGKRPNNPCQYRRRGSL